MGRVNDYAVQLQQDDKSVFGARCSHSIVKLVMADSRSTGLSIRHYYIYGYAQGKEEMLLWPTTTCGARFSKRFENTSFKVPSVGAVVGLIFSKVKLASRNCSQMRLKRFGENLVVQNLQSTYIQLVSVTTQQLITTHNWRI